jgi:hypothetical protein
MKIDFLRSGGIAGLRLTAAVDTDTLPSEDASRILQMVEAAGLFDLEPGSDQLPATDRYQYRLRIESPVWGLYENTLSESAVPDELRPLLEFLTGLALNRAGSAFTTETPDDSAG